MSLEIDTRRVRHILLPDGEWHDLVEASFAIDEYEYVKDTDTVFAGGHEKDLTPSSGATWRERHESGQVRTAFCPLTSIQAVSYDA